MELRTRPDESASDDEEVVLIDSDNDGENVAQAILIGPSQSISRAPSSTYTRVSPF